MKPEGMFHRQLLNVNPEDHTYNKRCHRKTHSNSTQDDRDHSEPREDSIDGKKNKLKSQLCKKFMENGCCPYDKKCKFAHGLN